MTGRSRTNRGGGYEVEERRASQRYSRKRGNNTPVLIAVGAAAVVAIVVVLILAGSSPEQEYSVQAKQALREFLQACIENRPALGMDLVDPRFVLRDENLDEMKHWRELSAERREELTDQAFRWLQMKVTSDLEFTTMDQVDAVLVAAESKYKASESRIDLFWQYGGKNWNAALSNFSGRWLVLRLDKRSGG